MSSVHSTYKQYQFNEHNVCLNPEHSFSFSKKNIYCLIEIAETPKGFISSHDYRISGSEVGCGGSSSPCSKTGPYFKTKEDATLYEAEMALEYFTRKDELVKTKQLTELIDLINSLKKPTDGQLLRQLFNQPHKTHKLKKMQTANLRMVPVTSIQPSKTNALHREPFELEPASLNELTESIKTNGVIQPILIRPAEKQDTYYLVCGERRFVASKLAKLKEVPAFIRELTEEQAFDLQVVENLQRKDVHPMKEAQGYKALIEANPEKNTTQELARRFGKSPEYIAQRLSFNNLIDEMKKEFIEGKMLIGHAMAFSRLTENDQRECWVKCKIKMGPSEGLYEPLNTVNAFISQSIIRDLNKAVFNPNDGEMLPSAGACVNCTKRSGDNLLFADIKEKDRCFDGSCFSAKTSIHLVNKISDMKQDNPTIAVVGIHGNHVDTAVKKYLTKNSIKLLRLFTDYNDAAKSDKGAIKALSVAGNNIGEIVYIKPVDGEKITAAKPAVAKNTPEHFDEQIAIIRGQIADSKKEMENNVQKDIVKRALDLKHYNDVCNIPLEKFEKAIVLMEIVENQISAAETKKIMAWVKKLPVDNDVPKAAHLAYQFANVPADIEAYIFRSFIRMIDIEKADTNSGIAFRMAAEKWKGVNIETITADNAAVFNLNKESLEGRITELQDKKKAIAKAKPEKK